MLINEAKYVGEDEMVCPYCEHPQDSPWDWKKHSAKVECQSCAKKFKYVRNVKTTYDTWELE